LRQDSTRRNHFFHRDFDAATLSLVTRAAPKTIRKRAKKSLSIDQNSFHFVRYRASEAREFPASCRLVMRQNGPVLSHFSDFQLVATKFPLGVSWLETPLRDSIAMTKIPTASSPTHLLNCSLTHRLAFVSFVSFVVFILLPPAPAAEIQERTLTLEYRGKMLLSEETTTDQNGQPFKIEGTSGVTRCEGNKYVAVMDNSNHVVFLSVSFKPDGSIDKASVTGGLSVTTSRDYEGIAYTNAERNSVFLSNEATPPPPALYEYSLATGQLLQTVAMPPVFMGQRDNRGLESLTRRADGREIWTANEEALTADGPMSTATSGTVVRLVRFTVSGNTLTAAQQYAYNVDPIHIGLGKAYCSGISDLVVLPDGTLLTLERSAMEGLPFFQTRIYQVDLMGATDISQGSLAAGLIGQNYAPVKKKLLLSTSKIGENLEGLCLGPELSAGHWALLGVVDNGDPVSKNTLVAFELIEPAKLPVALIAEGGGVAVLLLILIFALSRRRSSLARPEP
jgi:hypothetical protein